MPRYRQAMNRSARAWLDDPHLHATFGPSRPLEGALREASHEQDGMRRPAGLLHASNPPGGVRQHRPSATTSGTCECTNVRPTGTAHVHRPGLAKAGPEPTNRRGGAPRGERPRMRARSCLEGTQGGSLTACGPTSLARRRVPLHPSACRRSASLVGDEGNRQTSEGLMPRENDEVCPRDSQYAQARSGATSFAIRALARRAEARRAKAGRSDRI